MAQQQSGLSKKQWEVLQKVRDNHNKTSNLRLNRNTLASLERNGLIEITTRQQFMGHDTGFKEYGITEKGRSDLEKNTYMPKGNMDEKVYSDNNEIQAALDRGESIHIEVESFAIPSELLRMARQFQDKERLEEWKASQKASQTEKGV